MGEGELHGMFRRLGITGQAAAILMIVFGVLIIVFPSLLHWLVGIYLIIGGLISLAGHVGGAKAAS